MKRWDDELLELLDVIEARSNVSLHGHARAALAMRARGWLSAKGLDDLASLVDWVRGSDDRAFALAAALCGRTPRMFDDPIAARVFRACVAPWLRTYPSINVWLPECSTGEEIYETAILLLEEGLLPRSHVYATDPNDAMLEAARVGKYSRATIAAATFAHEQSGARASFDAYYRSDGDRVRMVDALREHVTFSRHSFASDASFNEFHLIVCRDVLLNFDPRLHVRACDVIHESAGHLGFLVLGRGESMSLDPHRELYEVVAESSVRRRVI